MVGEPFRSAVLERWGRRVRLLIPALRKELILQWSGRAQVLGAFVFGASALLLFSFAIGPNAGALRMHSAGFLWLALLLASTLTLAESFRSELEGQALEGTLLLPVSPVILFYAKAIANWLLLTLIGSALIPLMVVLYNAETMEIGALLVTIAAGSAGLAAPGTLYAGMSSQVRARQLLLPLLLFPLIVPALLASVKATSLLILGDPMGERGDWMALLAAFDAIYWALCGLLFGRVVED